MGKDDEMEIMLDILHSENAEILAVYGHCRVRINALIYVK